MAAPVKSTEGTSTLATVTASLGSASIAGNLLTLKVAADDYAASPPSGWTQSTGMKQETYHGGYFWWKISTGDTSVNYTIGSAANSSWVMEEYAGPFDGSPYDTSNGTLAISSAGSAATPNITPSAGDRLVLAALGSSNSSGDMSGDLTGFTNGFTHTRSSGPASATGTRDNIGGAYLDVTANGSTAYNTTGSFPFTKQSHSAMIIAFKKASGGGSVTGTLAATEAGDTAALTGAVVSLGTFAATEGSDTASLSGSLSDVGSLSATEAGDAAAFNAALSLSGSFAVTETQDAASLSGSVVLSGTLSVTDQQDSASFTTIGDITGSLAATEQPDVGAFVASVIISGSLSASEAVDASVFNGSVLSLGALQATEQADTASFSSTGQISGSLAVTEAKDTAALSGAVVLFGSFSALESPDTARITDLKVVPSADRLIQAIAENRTVVTVLQSRLLRTEAEGRTILADQPPRIAA